MTSQLGAGGVVLQRNYAQLCPAWGLLSGRAYSIAGAQRAAEQHGQCLEGICRRWAVGAYTVVRASPPTVRGWVANRVVATGLLSGRRLARLREEGLLERMTLPQAGRRRVWFPTTYWVRVVCQWPELRRQQRYPPSPRRLFVLDGTGPAGIENRTSTLHAAARPLVSSCTRSWSSRQRWPTCFRTALPHPYGSPSKTPTAESAGIGPGTGSPPLVPRRPLLARP